MFIKLFFFILEFKLFVFLSEKFYSQVVGFCKIQLVLFQCDIDNELFFFNGKIKFVFVFDFLEKVGFLNIIYLTKVLILDFWVL